MVSYSNEILLTFRKNFSGNVDEGGSEMEDSEEEEEEEESNQESDDDHSEMREDEGDEDAEIDNQILYKMLGFLVEDEEEERYLYFYEKEKNQFKRSDGLDVKSEEDFKSFDVVVGFYEKMEAV